MEALKELGTIAGGMLLSLACGLLLEELIFGGLVRLFFASQLVSGDRGKKRSKETGGKSC